MEINAIGVEGCSQRDDLWLEYFIKEMASRLYLKKNGHICVMMKKKSISVGGHLETSEARDDRNLWRSSRKLSVT